MTACVQVIVPTFCAGEGWSEFIDCLSKQKGVAFQTLIVDSESTDQTAQKSIRAGFEVMTIPAAEFNHGGTRQLAFEKTVAKANPHCEYVVFMTQDALLHGARSLAYLLKPFKNPKVAAVYGRQLPHDHATRIAARDRAFNYPSQSQLKSFEDRHALGLKTIFLSNSFAAYRISALLEIGGFVQKVVLGEDMCAAALLLKSGHSIYYQARAQVKHSHNYSSLQEFQRFFDTGVMHASQVSILSFYGSAHQQGFTMLRHHFSACQDVKPWVNRFIHFLNILWRVVLKGLGYHLGLRYTKLPRWLIVRCSMFKAYWT